MFVLALLVMSPGLIPCVEPIVGGSISDVVKVMGMTEELIVIFSVARSFLNFLDFPDFSVFEFIEGNDVAGRGRIGTTARMELAVLVVRTVVEGAAGKILAIASAETGACGGRGAILIVLPGNIETFDDNRSATFSETGFKEAGTADGGVTTLAVGRTLFGGRIVVTAGAKRASLASMESTADDSFVNVEHSEIFELLFSTTGC